VGGAALGGEPPPVLRQSGVSEKTVVMTSARWIESPCFPCR